MEKRIEKKYKKQANKKSKIENKEIKKYGTQ